MYRISNIKRKYSGTPIVKVTTDANGREQEEMVLCVVNMRKAEADKFAEELLELMNRFRFNPDIKSQPWYEEMKNYIANGQNLMAVKIYKDHTGCSLDEAREYVMSIKKIIK